MKQLNQIRNTTIGDLRAVGASLETAPISVIVRLTNSIGDYNLLHDFCCISFRNVNMHASSNFVLIIIWICYVDQNV